MIVNRCVHAHTYLHIAQHMVLEVMLLGQHRLATPVHSIFFFSLGSDTVFCYFPHNQKLK